jgi:hypothetical protein
MPEALDLRWADTLLLDVICQPKSWRIYIHPRLAHAGLFLTARPTEGE